MTTNAEYWSFPTNPEEFDQDERISFSRLDNKHIAVQDDGTEYEFDPELKRWIPIFDEALIEEQQRGYMMPNAGADTGDDLRGHAPNRKRKLNRNDREDNNNHHDLDRPSRPAKQKGNRGPPQPKQNTAIYVTGLPSDATAEEVAELFSKKCGVIAEEIDSGRPRIKMYTNADGSFKGDALVVFFKPQSVEMAIMLLDDTEFRFPPTSGASNTPKMRVQAADSSYKKTKYDGGENSTTPAEDGGTGSSGKSNNNNNNNSASNQRSTHDKAKIIKKTQKLSAKLADWSDDEPSAIDSTNPVSTATGGPASSKYDRLVILRHMFTLDELQEDPTALLDIKDDVREECAKLGPVTNVVLYDQEEEGIMSVKFKTREAAEACLRLMHGRAFAGRIVEAFFATGREKFRRSKGETGGGKTGDDDSDDGED
ncbi:uncharacterized protein C8A04DRAFT_8820 [Dichotomopilus funicola]|uniref:RRM domain-containing protein n=1 Tax=Dichotomopilus funicola TaxID=1934379 RepID=A0AAN6VA95_9PEZI|nr:hypothetical protein C8A04DRAFT_8820 [Dichotomopilus funicola]